MTTALKNTDIARLLADTSNADEIGSIARQVQHWTVSGLLSMASITIADPSVGRGRAREYPEESLPWFALMLAMAQRGISVETMASVIQGIQMQRAQSKKDGQPDLFAEAVTGATGPIFLIMTPVRFEGGHTLRFPVLRATMLSGPPEIKADWTSGVILNLTAVLARARD
ncbi:MAG: hypothetical protein O7G13_15800 [Alphaproteobacteria bacterium]|nr:hypothetical protein [Alphaproteobacteria bacterium]